MKIRDPHNQVLAALTVLMLASCNQAPQGDQFPAIAAGGDRLDATTAIAQSQPRSCLLLLWDAAGGSDVAFDRAHDVVSGGTISCATGTTPTRFKQALDRIGSFAKQRNPASLADDLADKVLFIDVEGERRQITATSSSAERSAVFTPDVMDALATLHLSDLTVVPEQGAFIALGGIWFGVADTGGDPKIRTINRQALVEARTASAE